MTHQAIAATALSIVEEISVPMPKPGPDDIVQKNQYAAMIAFDAYQLDRGYMVQEYPVIFGFSASGTVHEVGSNVKDLKVGDRVTTYTYATSDRKAMQKYTIAPRAVVAKVPDGFPLDEAATIPDNFVTAFFTLFGKINLGLPFSYPQPLPATDSHQPILIWGGGSSSAQYTIQLLKLVGYNNIITTASLKHTDALKSLGATHVLDYKDPNLVESIKKAAAGVVNIAVDVVAVKSSLETIAAVTGAESKIAVLLPVKIGSTTVTGPADTEMILGIPDNIQSTFKGSRVFGIRTFLYLEDKYCRENLMPNILPGLLKAGAIQPNKLRLLSRGSFKERVEIGLDLLRNNKVSSEKVVVAIPE